MKYLILTLFLSVSCSGGYVGYNVPECSSRATSMTEDIIIMEYVKRASETEVCTSMFGNRFHYITNGPGHYVSNNCEPMPKVVNIECFSNCLTQYYSCFIFHSDGYVVQDVRKFGEERILPGEEGA